MDFENIYTDKKPYDMAFLGGTFDRFHHAHESLIRTAVMISDNVFVGVVSDELGLELFSNKVHGDKIQSYDLRSVSVVDFLSTFGIEFAVGELFDYWGPAPYDETDNGALVVSRETQSSGVSINSIREGNGLVPLDVIVIPWLRDKSGRLVSSTQLRVDEFGGIEG